MNKQIIRIGFGLLVSLQLYAVPHFEQAVPVNSTNYTINTSALCKTAKQTLAYLNKGNNYDPKVIHNSKLLPIKLSQVKATLRFICQHQDKLNDANFIIQHFDFIRWHPDKK